STLVLHTVSTGDEEVVFETEELIEAPNWSPCGGFLVINGKGLIYRLALSDGATPVQIDTGGLVDCNNDHGISPDGQTLVISDGSQTDGSCIYTVPMAGGTPKRITDKTPSYWHGWSPDGQTLAYTARRDGVFNIFTIPVDGGEECQLTFGSGHRDGPDYTPDGTWIWFNSDHHGATPDLWRMRTDGSGLEQMTHDGFVNWFPHPAPSGEYVLYLAYPPHVTGHPRGEDVALKLMPTEGGPATTLVAFHGGQGSINVPNWSPKGDRFAYVRYGKTA
ncbi:UNVERIFIED_CONTAM: hypothetical protein GTU68_018553, partial [Idotea baltica]|nr:hypothetical protein [Idotea baltica]